MSRRQLPQALCFLALAVLTIGCSKEELTEKLSDATQTVKDTASDTAQTVQDKAQQASETIREAANMAGNIELTLDGPTQAGRCYITFGQVSPELPAVLQIASYKGEADESFPSVFFRGTTSTDTLDALAGQNVSGTLYVQAVEDGPVWHTPPGSTVELTLDTVGDQIVGRITGGTLVNLATTAEVAPTGQFTAVRR